MHYLTELDLSSNAITDISLLASIPSLTVLNLSRNHLTDLSALAGLTELDELNLRNNNITDILPLVENSGLSLGCTVNVDNNPLSEESVEVYIPQLKARNVSVIYGETPLSIVWRRNSGISS